MVEPYFLPVIRGVVRCKLLESIPTGNGKSAGGGGLYGSVDTTADASVDADTVAATADAAGDIGHYLWCYF